jgi:HAD superfamily phosphatase (TIGR01668 family)
MLQRLSPLLEPDLITAGVLADLPLDVLLAHQIRALVLDVDATLLPRTCAEPSQAISRWIEAAARQLPLHLFSNNPDHRRIAAIARRFDLPFTAAACKPRRGALRQVLEQLQLPAAQVAMIGDRLFTDVIAGNRLGLFTVLVQAIDADGRPAVRAPVQRAEMALARLVGAQLDSASQARP